MLGEQIDRLVDEIDRVKSEIKKFKTSLGPSEDQTRGILIDPMLRALGWNMGDSSQVYRQYPIGGGRVDYALIDVDQKPVAIVEAKGLNKPLDDEHRKQVASYAKNIRRGLSVLTNGDKWELYDNTRRRVKFDHWRILTVSIAEQSSLACAVPLLQLWRPYLVPDQPAPSVVPVSAPRPTSPATAASIQPRPPAPGAGWTTLRGFSAKKGGKCPPKVRFTNGEERDIRSWKGLLVEVAEWLIRDGILTADKCPVPTSGGYGDSYCLVNSGSKHPDGTDMFKPHILSNGLFLATSGGSDTLVRKSIALMERLSKDPAAVHVQVG